MMREGCPIPGAIGCQKPSGTGSCGVLVLGEAMGKEEAAESRGFIEYAQAGSVLERAFRRMGMNREQFVIWNVVPVQPPHNYLEGAPWEAAAISWGLKFVDEVIDQYKPRAIVSLGNVATRAATGLAGRHLTVSMLTGFVLPSPRWGIPVIPSFHPAYLRRGKMSHFGLLLRGIRLATVVAREGRQPLLPDPDNPPPGYKMYPTEDEAIDFALHAELQKGFLAYDIETSQSTVEDEAEEAEGDKQIKSVQFSLGPGTGIFMPWRDPYIKTIKRVLALNVPKLGWNIWRFDDPILRANDVYIAGQCHDLMWAWHHAQPDIPRGLQFAAAQQGWPWPWKHLDQASPQFYGIVDVDVLQWMVR